MGDSYPADSVGARSLGITALLDRGVRFEGYDRSWARSVSDSFPDCLYKVVAMICLGGTIEG